MGGIRERLDTLTRGELAGLVIVIVATLAGAGLWYLRSLPKPVEVAMTQAPLAAAPGSPAGGSASVGSATPTAAASVIVDVTGWVRDPGVYEFAIGARVVDAVDRAGGPRGGADLSQLNLAAPLVDGQQVMVPKEGQTVTAPGSGGVGSVPGEPGSAININSADAAAFEMLNGIGEVLAAAIVAYRDEHGPFTSVDQLEEVPGIGPSTLEEIRDQVMV